MKWEIHKFSCLWETFLCAEESVTQKTDNLLGEGSFLKVVSVKEDKNLANTCFHFSEHGTFRDDMSMCWQLERWMQCYKMEEKWPVIKTTTTTLKGTAQGTIRREVKWKEGLCSHCKSSMVCLFSWYMEQSLLCKHGAWLWWRKEWMTMKLHFTFQFSSVQSLSCVWLFATPWITARQASLSITNSRSSLKLMCIESVMPSSHLILCHPLLLLPPIPPSITVFSNESTLRMRWPKYWSFIFNISPSKKHPGLISFRMAWMDLLAVQGTLKSLLQHHSSKASILRRSAFFTV